MGIFGKASLCCKYEFQIYKIKFKPHFHCSWKNKNRSVFLLNKLHTSTFLRNHYLIFCWIYFDFQRLLWYYNFVNSVNAFNTLPMRYWYWLQAISADLVSAPTVLSKVLSYLRGIETETLSYSGFYWITTKNSRSH